jgi:branched-chain amino acid transport system permease protein
VSRACAQTGSAIELRLRGARLGTAFGLALVVLLLVAPVAGLPTYLTSLLIEVMIFAVFAMSLDLLLGYTGLVSLGHAAFFAVGAYAAGIAANHLTTDILVTAAVGLAAAAVLAVLIGWLSIRLSGFYFLMITFAFAQMVYSVAYRWNWLTGGSDGMIIPGATLFGSPVLASRLAIYYSAVALLVLSWLVMRRLVTSPFGEVLVGIRENTTRMRAIGFNVRRYKLAVFVIAAVFAAAAGILNGQFILFISPEAAHWTQSAGVLVMVLVGGAGTLAGPIIGATVVLLLQNWLSSYTEYWSLALGILFVLLITWARSGLLGITRQLWLRLAGRSP